MKKITFGMISTILFNASVVIACGSPEVDHSDDEIMISTNTLENLDFNYGEDPSGLNSVELQYKLARNNIKEKKDVIEKVIEVVAENEYIRLVSEDEDKAKKMMAGDRIYLNILGESFEYRNFLNDDLPDIAYDDEIMNKIVENFNRTWENHDHIYSTKTVSQINSVITNNAFSKSQLVTHDYDSHGWTEADLRIADENIKLVGIYIAYITISNSNQIVYSKKEDIMNIGDTIRFNFGRANPTQFAHTITIENDLVLPTGFDPSENPSIDNPGHDLHESYMFFVEAVKENMQKDSYHYYKLFMEDIFPTGGV